MKNRRIVLVRKIYWTACDNKNEEGETNPNLIGGVPEGVEGELIYRYETTSLREPSRVMKFFEFKPILEKYRAYGGGRFMTLDDALYREFMNYPYLSMEGQGVRMDNLELDRLGE